MKLVAVLQETGRLEYGKDDDEHSEAFDTSIEKQYLYDIKQAIDSSAELKKMLGAKFAQPYDVTIEAKGPKIEIKITPEDGTKPYTLNIATMYFDKWRTKPKVLADILLKKA
jgi:hypothetical protein